MDHSDSLAAAPAKRPNLDGGRPTDPMIVSIEAHVEAIVALEADAQALDHILHALVRVRRCTSRLETVASERIDRIRDVSIPEVRRGYDAAEGLRAA